MERSLVAGAILLLFLEVGLLLTGLNDVPNWSTGSGSANSHGRLIGKMKRTESNVRRRAQSSLVWEESRARDPLFEFDSVLTLAGSAAQIQFNSKTTLNIDENTLVVLEESPDQENGSLRVRFSRGMIRSQNPGRPLEIKSESWTLTASEGSVVNLVSLHDGRFDLELTEGQALLNSADSSQEITRGERLLINNAEIEERKRLDDTFTWNEDMTTRIYTRVFPVETELRWTGEAASLRLITPDKKNETIPLTTNASSEQSHKLALNEGTYLISLEKDGRVSETRTIQVRQAPLFRYYSPLPRNRIETGTESTFSWETSEFAEKYRLEISPSRDFASDVQSWTLDAPRFMTTIEKEGSLFWRVIGLDDKETPIPEPRIYPLYITPNPFKSPELNAPTIRRPASPSGDAPPEERSEKRTGAGFWWKLLIPNAHATSDSNEDISDFEALFTWSEVEGADHYIIEISKSPGFEEPVVIQRTNSPQFLWRRFARGVYFWRVAAGRSQNSSQGDRLGLFSPLAVANLENPETFAGPGVTVARKKPRPTPAPLHAPVEPKEPAPEDQKEAAPKEITAAPEPSGPELPSTWSKRLIWRPSYRLVEAEGAQGIKGSFAGPSLLAFESELQVTSPRGRFWQLRLTYDETAWQPKDSGVIPFQSSLKEQRMSADLFSGRKSSSWSYGLGAEILPVFKRKAAEEGELQNLAVFGLSARYLKSLSERSQLDVFMTSRFGEVFGLRLRADWRFDIMQTERAIYTISPSVSYGYFQSDETKLRDLQTGLYFAIEW